MIKFISSFNWVYTLAIKLIANRIVHNGEFLTTEYLESKGWVKENEFYVEPRVKDRDKIWVQFENHYYKVWHGENKTFIALETRKEWFDTYYLLLRDRQYRLAGVRVRNPWLVLGLPVSERPIKLTL